MLLYSNLVEGNQAYSVILSLHSKRLEHYA
jgi:hypothetical protein